MKMELDFKKTLPAIWLVFGGTYLNHTNAPKCHPDTREQVLVDLLRTYLESELVNPSLKLFQDSYTQLHLSTVCGLLKLWSKDLELIYQIRESKNNDFQVKQLAQQFLERVATFDDCTIIPNGLVSALHANHSENVSVGILKKKHGLIDWIQVDPGSAYHQHCTHIAGEKSNAYLEILGMDPENITEDLLYLLVGLKAVSLNHKKSSYRDVSLYEGLLSHLNGRTVFQSEPDEGFIVCSHSSPTHTWLVIDQSFRFFLRHFLGETYQVVYQQLLINFKLFLMEKTLRAYRNQFNGGEQLEQCHFLLQEMCRDIAQYSYELGNKQQKTCSLQLINDTNRAIKEYSKQQKELVCRESQLRVVRIKSLKFVPPYVKVHAYSSGFAAFPSLRADPVVVLPTKQEDIIRYLHQFKFDFIDKLIKFEDIHRLTLLSHGIEAFFIEYLAETNILETSTNLPFSRCDTSVADILKQLGDIYFSCQNRLVNKFFSIKDCEPEFYAKNVTIQFFVYAAVAALNYRDPNIGPLLTNYNLNVSVSKTLSFINTISRLVVNDFRWVKVLLALQVFFMPKINQPTLFSSQLTIEVNSNADETDTDTKFAYQLLQKYPDAFLRFTEKYSDLEDENRNRKWSDLTHSDTYLPSLYVELNKVAAFAKLSLTGFPFRTDKNRLTASWKISTKQNKVPPWHVRSTVKLTVNGQSNFSPTISSDAVTSYLVKSTDNKEKNPYQRLISCGNTIKKDKARTYFLENEIIANQYKKPGNMDWNRYIQLGFLRSEPRIKFERLYIALKKKHLDFSSEEESILMKQTLFEMSLLLDTEGVSCSSLEWIVDQNPNLIHAFGSLCVKEALTIKHRLTQHHAIGEILLVNLGLLAFYPAQHKNEFIDGIIDIYRLLKATLANPPAHLNDNILLHLNAYLIIAIQTKLEMLETETLSILKALLAIQNYKVKGTSLDNIWSLRVYKASFMFSSSIHHQLTQNPSLLNDLMLTIIPQWSQGSLWKKSDAGILFTCNDYAIKPLLGCIFFKNQPIMGLPEKITGHVIFQEYLGVVNFPVISASRQINGWEEASCFLSVDRKPKLRLTLIGSELLLEEWVETDYQRYIPAEQLLGHYKYPRMLYEMPDNKAKLYHWLDNDNILIKDSQQKIIFKWDLRTDFLFSPQHNGYVVPWEHVKKSFFKTCLECIELPGWIEIIAQPSSDSLNIHIESLNLPRLGLNFYYKQGRFFSKQIHGYSIAKTQFLSTLEGFFSFLILERKEEGSVQKHIKVLIPHRKVTPEGPFYVNTITLNRGEVQNPAYFVYDYDSKLGVLKSQNIRAQLYLALLYFRSASFDEDDLSHCNAYHLARENLELCWKDQPYDNIELSIIEQLLDVSAIHQRGLHSHLVALYLKVVSLLSSSLRLSFLFTDETSEQNKKRSDELLQRCAQKTPLLSLIYLQNKSNIFARIRLTPEEEKDALTHWSPKKEENDENASSAEDEEAEEDESIHLLPLANKCYNSHYRTFFQKEALKDTTFHESFLDSISLFNFAFDSQGIDFSAGIKEISFDRFRMVHFITLYNLAKRSDINVNKYRYLLHHLLIRAKINYLTLEPKLVMMLGRALLLVAEKPASFPDSPHWFNDKALSVDLSKRQLIKSQVFQSFVSFSRQGRNQTTRKTAVKDLSVEENNKENQIIWSQFTLNDLDEQGIPLCLPKNPCNFMLQYEKGFKFSDVRKRDIVREHYLQAVYNNLMYLFFECVFQKCDKLKYDSGMSWFVAPFINNTIAVKLKTEEEQCTPSPEPMSLEKWAVAHEPLIVLGNFVSMNPLPAENNQFLFESQLEEQNGYHLQFYTELKESWLTYTKEIKYFYSWLHADSAKELESLLQMKYIEIDSRAKEIWDRIAAQFEQRSNTESNDYFALRWFSGQVCHYHKRDILRLIIEPYKIVNYNPDCVQKSERIIQDLLDYVTCEISLAKIAKEIILMKQFKQAEKQSEQFLVLQSLVKSLQENLDPASYRYPHWFLFQLENGIIVRNNQRELIDAMLNQTEKAMYQLNMGEGKSSVILPLLSCDLANGQQLLRINVLSALLTTMKEILRQRFSGLIQKRVYTLPFTRDTDISTEHLESVFEMLETCQKFQHILLTTPEHRLCLQLKIRELLLENQEQTNRTSIFNWQTYRKRAQAKMEVYQDLNEKQVKELLKKQDQYLRTRLLNQRFIDSKNCILKAPPRTFVSTKFVPFKKSSSHFEFREWSCLKAAYRELLYNCPLDYEDSTKRLLLLNEIDAVTAIDLLDESDEILKHGTELNYTVGDKHVFAGGELRWQLPQFFIKSIFCDSELRKIITKGKINGFTVINLHFSSQGGVPFIQLLDESYYEDNMKPSLINRFFQENLPHLRRYHLSADKLLVEGKPSSLRDFVAGKLPPNTEKKILSILADKGSLKDKLLITKGWLSHGILFHVFNAKYRVEYGLSLSSTKQVAIPFFGKDTPSPRSEFSHPDVTLGFTIISYLYQGLSQKQLKKTLNKLKDRFTHQVADVHLSAWTEAGRDWIQSQTNEFPPFLLKSLQHVDLKDEEGLEKVHQYLSGNHMAIFFYLNEYVLLEEAMQHLTKISANAHSLVGYNPALGFSGTDDRKITMPFQVKSLRSISEIGTNGKLLSVLTQARNRDYNSLQTENTIDLLKTLCKYAKKKRDCHALIDAGALVSGLTNIAVAEFLLGHLPSRFQGVLYFSDEGNSLTVLTRDQKNIPLQDCYLDKEYLFAYLDDIHTRGTDIQLPLNCHAILTIGLGMEKDKLMQAAMRLRHLAQKQSVSLWGTEAVTYAIARGNNLRYVTSIDSLEVIKWVTQNTINRINKDLFPVAIRKVDFHFLRKAESWLKQAPAALKSLVKHCQEKELFRLEDFYAFSPQYVDLADELLQSVNSRTKTLWEEVEDEMKSKQLTGTEFYKKVCQSDKAAFRKVLSIICEEVTPYLQSGYVRNSLNDDEEKEVEMEVEIEVETIEQGVNVSENKDREEYSEILWDASLILRNDFIFLAEQQKIIVPLNRIKDFIEVPANLKNVTWHKNIYMTTNYVHSVKPVRKKKLDNFLRPVDVVLIHHCTYRSAAVLLSGQEAAQIKSICKQEMGFNILTHIDDINGPTQWPLDKFVSHEDEKLLTIVKLFSGECHYTSLKEVYRIAKRVGRLYPHYFMCLDVPVDVSEKLFGILIEEGYLDFAGVMTQWLISLLREKESREMLLLDLPTEYQSYRPILLEKLHSILLKLIFVTPSSLKCNHSILKEWVGTRRRLKEYSGSALESVLNLEYEPKCSQ